MVFQILDDKKDCVGYYANEQIIYNKPPMSASRTWNYSEHLQNHEVDYAYLWAEGKSLSEICPEHLKTRLAAYEKRIKAQFKAFNKSKINFEDICFYDLVPNKQIEHYFQIRNEICEWVFDNYEKPRNYNFLLDTYITCQRIRQNNVSINMHKLYNHAKTDTKARNLLKWIQTNPELSINYDIFGSVTGRLTTKNGSFPIMNLKNEIKDVVEPKWDCFVEFDFNAAEIRTMISLMGQKQPQEDIHEWNIKNIFKEEMSREKAKQKIFAWLYNPESNAIKSDAYDRERLLEKTYCEGKVETPFGRTIAAPDSKALNYLLQSTSSDNTIDRFNKISRYLRSTRSHVMAVVHDSVIIDLHKDDRRIIPHLKQIFEDTKLGKFKVNVSLGRNLGQMKKFEW